MTPPVWARALLRAAAGEAQSELVTGDLHEEFLLLCAARGRRAGSRWYSFQVLRSIPMLLQLRIRSGELAQAAAAAVFGTVLPLLFLDRLWCFVYSQVPLKCGLDRAPLLLAINIAAVCAGSVAAGFAAGGVTRKTTLAMAMTMAAALGLWMSAGAAPPWYSVAVLSGAAMGSSMAAVAKRRFS